MEELDTLDDLETLTPMVAVLIHFRGPDPWRRNGAETKERKQVET